MFILSIIYLLILKIAVNRIFCFYFVISSLLSVNNIECLYSANIHKLRQVGTFINSHLLNHLCDNTFYMKYDKYKKNIRGNNSLSSLSDYAHNIKKKMGPKSTSRWGRKLDKESTHNFGNITGNEDIGGCNPEYKFPESFFDEQDDGYFWPPTSTMKKTGDLYKVLRGKEGAPYGNYKSLLGEWTIEKGTITVTFDRIQSDPFAPPSNIRVRISQNEANFPHDLIVPKIRNVASRDYIARGISDHLSNLDSGQPFKNFGKKKGFHITTPSQYVLDRKSVVLTPDFVEARLYVDMPAHGRRIDGRQAARLFNEVLPKLCKKLLYFESYEKAKFYKHVECLEDQQCLRNSLESLGLVAFVANGSILPRLSGTSHKPLKSPDVKLFKSPENLRVTIKTPNRGDVVGMGIKAGVTVIVGGGYHGKTTLLEALQLGVYNKVPGDGREFVVTSPNCVKIRAEDGRSVNRLDISTFIGNLPNGKSGTDFSTKDASGSTSQAAGIMESLEMGADLLLIDEDISASNFMYRDQLMDELVSKDKEPITPFLSLVRPFYDKLKVSTILVSGSCGLFTTQANLVLQMDEYECLDVTEKSKQLSSNPETGSVPRINLDPLKLFNGNIKSRLIGKATFDRPARKVKQRGLDKISYGADDIDLRLVEQLVEVGQTCTITNILMYLEDLYRGPQEPKRTIRELLESLYDKWNTNTQVGFTGLDQVNGFKHFPAGDCSMPRIFEVAAAINRMGTLRVTDFVESEYKPQQKYNLTD